MLLLIECKYTILQRYGVTQSGKRAKSGASLPDKNKSGSVMAPLVHGGAPGSRNRVSPKRQVQLDSSDSSENEASDMSNCGLVKQKEGLPVILRLSRVPTENLSFSEVGYFALGPLGERIVDFALVVSQIGFCCAYLIFITENLSSYLPMRTELWLILMSPFLYLLTLIRHLHRLAFFSLFAQFSNLMAFAVVFWFDFDHIAHATRRSHPKRWSLEGFPFFFAVAIYCYEGAGMILSLEYSLARSVRPDFKKYFLSVMILVTSLYIAFGLCGYLSFGPETNAIITLNLPRGLHGPSAAMLVKLCLCVALFFTYPVMMFPVTELLQRKLTIECAVHERILRLCLVLATVVIVALVPSFADLMALIGATCCTLLAFILPALFHWSLHHRTARPSAKLLDAWLVFVGISGAIVSTLDTLSRLNSPAVSDELGIVPSSVWNNVSSPTELSTGTSIIFGRLPSEAVPVEMGMGTSINDTIGSLVHSVLSNKNR